MRQPMSAEERAFFERLGLRVAALRKEIGLTQAQLAESLGNSQQQIVSFEKGRRRMQVFMLPRLASALGVSVEELLGDQSRPKKRGPTPALQRQLEQLARLPKSKQQFVSAMIETLLQQAG